MDDFVYLVSQIIRKLHSGSNRQLLDYMANVLACGVSCTIALQVGGIPP